jgi:hypothetical protein
MGDDTYDPPRCWWLTRIGVGVVLLVLGLVGIHVGLGYAADAKDERLRIAWRGDGGAHPDDVDRITHVPPNEPDNAAFHLHKVVTTLPPMTAEQRQWWNDADRAYPLGPNDVRMLRDIAAAAELLLMQMDPALQIETPMFDWGVPATDLGMILPLLNEQRAVANRLGFSMQLAVHESDAAALVRDAERGLVLGESIRSYGNVLVSALVAMGVEAVVHQYLLDAVLHMGDAAWQQDAPQVRRLIDRLLDGSDHDRMQQAMLGERVLIATSWKTVGPGTTRLVLSPHLRIDLLRLAEEVTHEAGTAGVAATMPQAMRELDAYELGSKTVAGLVTRMLSYVMDSSYDRAFESHYRAMADRRMAAVALAVELYAADHDGSLPPDLATLVPAYLPHVPRDPFARGDVPLGYRTDLRLPIVYSVGKNGTDDGGSVAPPDEATLRRLTQGNVFAFDYRDYVQPLRLSPIEGVDPWNYLYDGGTLRLRNEARQAK